MATPKQSADEFDSPTTLTDERLVQLCIDGNHDAWCRLIDRYRNLIFSIPVRQGLLREDAAEIFQEVCLKLLAHLPRLRKPRTLAAWLITVTSHECTRWRRLRARYCTHDMEEASLAGVTEFNAPIDGEDEFRREQALREAISEVGARCRDLVQLLFFTTPAVRYDQLARRLGVATGSIGFIRMRCLKRLRRLLEDKGFS